MSTIKVDNLETVAGVPLHPAKAWVNYNQTTPAINGSSNISSMTDDSTGVYTANFATSMSGANYSSNLLSDAPVSTWHVQGHISSGSSTPGTYTTSAAQFAHFNQANSGQRADPQKACLQFVE